MTFNAVPHDRQFALAPLDEMVHRGGYDPPTLLAALVTVLA